MKLTPLLLLGPITWASLGFAGSAPQPPSPEYVWRQSQEKDAARTFTFTRYTLVGQFLSPPSIQIADRPALALDCIPSTGSHPAKGKFLTANLLVGGTLKVVYVEPEEIHGTSYYPKVIVRYRTDKIKQEEEKWLSGTDKASASIPKDAMKKILHAHTVAITTADDRGSQIDMQFILPDPTLVEQGCNIDEH